MSESPESRVAAVVGRVDAVLARNEAAASAEALLAGQLAPKLARAIGGQKIKFGIPGLRTKYSGGSNLTAKRWYWRNNSYGRAGDSYDKYDRKVSAHFLKKYPKIVAKIERQTRRREKLITKARRKIVGTEAQAHVD